MTYFRHRITGPGSAGDVWTTTLHSVSAADLATVHNAFAAAFQDFLINPMRPLWPTEVRMSEFVTDQLNPATGRNTIQARTSYGLVGTNTGDTMSPRSAIVTGLRTGLATRAGRGRMFWPAPAASELDDFGNLSSANAAAISLGLRDALEAMTTFTTPVVFHRSTLTGTQITSVTVGIVLGSQRRRTNKVVNEYFTATV